MPALSYVTKLYYILPKSKENSGDLQIRDFSSQVMVRLIQYLCFWLLGVVYFPFLEDLFSKISQIFIKNDSNR